MKADHIIRQIKLVEVNKFGESPIILITINNGALVEKTRIDLGKRMIIDRITTPLSKVEIDGIINYIVNME